VLVNYFDRVNLSVSQAALQSAFGISPVTFGYLLSAYSWTYAAFQLPSGIILDRFGVKLVGRFGTLLWSVASFAAAISTGLAGFFGARLLLGVGEAPTFPANAKAIGYWFPAQERSLATAIFDSAAKLASALGVPAMGLVLLYFGWRWSFAATGLISLLYFILFYCFYRNPSEDQSLSVAERDFILQGGAQPEDRGRAAKRAAQIFAEAAKSLGAGARFRVLQLHLLSLADMAAFVSLVSPSHRFAAFSFVHQRALAVCNVHRHCHGRLAGRQTNPARPRPVVRQASNPRRGHHARPRDAWSSLRAQHRHGPAVD